MKCYKCKQEFRCGCTDNPFELAEPIPLPEGEKFLTFHKYEDRLFVITDKSAIEVIKKGEK